MWIVGGVDQQLPTACTAGCQLRGSSCNVLNNEMQRSTRVIPQVTSFTSAEVDLGPACTPSSNASWDGEESNNQSLSKAGSTTNLEKTLNNTDAKSPTASENSVDKDKHKGDDAGSDSEDKIQKQPQNIHSLTTALTRL